jgi:hypothetical protein
MGAPSSSGMPVSNILCCDGKTAPSDLKWRRGHRHDGLYCAIFARHSIRVLRMCLPRLHSRDQILRKQLSSINGGIDSITVDSDELARHVAQNLSALKMAGDVIL